MWCAGKGDGGGGMVGVMKWHNKLALAARFIWSSSSSRLAASSAPQSWHCPLMAFVGRAQLLEWTMAQIPILYISIVYISM